MNKAKKILIIDDEESIVKVLREHFKGEGYKVIVAFDGQEGLEKAQKVKPDIILLDIIMPKLDGISTLKGLKGNSETQAIPVIILTNLETSNGISESLRKGSTDYLIKTDYTLEQLTEKVEQVLKNKH